MILTRNVKNANFTVGELSGINSEKVFTLELPDLDNKNVVSCIPAGVR